MPTYSLTIPDSQVRVITPDDLGATINKLTQALGKPSKHSQPALSILVSYSIARIGYNVPKVFKSFAIDVFKGSPSSYRLCISFDSTYSDAYTAAWTAQRRSLLDRQKFSQSACCYYNPAENLDLAQRMLTPVQDEPDCSAEDMEKMEFTIKDFVQTVAVGNNSAGNPVPQVSAATAAAPAPQPSADGSESWFQKWKGVIATVIGLGAGVGGAMATVKITAAGLYVSGPLGLSIAAGFVHGSMFAGAAAFGTGVGLGAAAMVYFIPWDVFFAYLKQKLWRIWESVVEAVKWVLNKMRELASTFVQQVKLAVANSLAGHKAGPFMR